MKIAIYGAGSLGTVLGAYLAKAKIDVDLVTRNKAQVDALNAHGAHVVGKTDFRVPVHALLPDQMRGKYDLIFLMTKALDNKDTVTRLKPLLKDDGDLVTFQNGLPELSICPILGEERTLGCTVNWGATLLSPGVSELTSDPSSMTFGLGRLDGKVDGKVKTVASLLEKMCPVRIETNFIGGRFSKLLINSAFSGISAVTGLTFGEASQRKESRAVIQALIKECIDVSKANGIVLEKVQGKDIVKLLDYHNPIKKWFSYLIIPLCIKKHRDLKASMLQDLEKGKRTEVDQINGAVVAYGKKGKIRTPYNKMAIRIIHEIESGKRKPCYENIREFQAIR